MFLLSIAAIPSAIYSLSPANRRSVLITDILALSFSHNALSVLKIDSFQTGSILLSGLFFYDIWWVFGTEVVSITPACCRIFSR
jgi:minor histocompatibility antigen H13